MDPAITLGLDLGSNSIGWALLDERSQKIVATGVRVFPEGVDRDQQGGEHSKSEQRRMARGMRRQIARRARRKNMLRRALVASGLLPDVALLPSDDPRRVEWERVQFQQSDSYMLRKRALSHRLEAHEIGRVLLHLNQRRGFLSNRKADRTKRKESSDILKEITGLAAEMGNRTLGEYLAEIHVSNAKTRLRNRHTRRDMYENEFEAIWVAQARHYPDLLTAQLKYGSSQRRQSYPCAPRNVGQRAFVENFGIHGCIFFQRPMYWPKSVVGKCELEPKQKRCRRADRLAQRFRLLQEVNNLRLLDSTTGEERALTSEERTDLVMLLARTKELEFTKIRKKLGMRETVRFNLERGDRDKLDGMSTDTALAKKDLFGKDWFERPEAEKNEIVHAILDEEEDTVRQKAQGKWGLPADAVEKLLAVDFPDGYSSYSRVAIQKLLPSLEKGLPLMAVDGQPCALREAGYLLPHERTVNQQEYLPPAPDLTNPLVRQALHEVRKVVNAIIREYGKPTTIHIEMPREIKGTSDQRAQMSKDNRLRERARDSAADELRQAGAKPTSETITNYLLWMQQKKECIYSGRPISLVQLLGGEVDVDHILPYGRSLDNSQMNRVICFRSENAAKGQRTPFEWLAKSDPGKFDQILQRANRLPYPKARKFRQESVTLDDFFARQFVDTAYITSQVREYVRCLGTDVVCSKGQHTAELRRHWGLNTVLRHDDLDIKNREDHRHHAVDAIVVALTTRQRLQKLAALGRSGGTEGTGEVLPEPWGDFRHNVETAISGINVSHRVSRKVQGPLHEETIYGPTLKLRPQLKVERPWAKGWIEAEGEFVHRKPLESLTLAEVDRIRDERVRELVRERLAQHNIKAGRKRKGDDEGDDESQPSARGIPKEVWKEPLLLHARRGASSTSSAVIKKVRLVKTEGTITPIRNGAAHVKPGKIHHLCIFEFQDERGKTKREALFVSLLEAARRRRSGEPIVQRAHPNRREAKFVMSLSQGEMVLGKFKGADRLVCFNTAASTQGQLYFLNHTDARPRNEATKFAVKANTLAGRKVTVDPLGRVRWAHD